MARVDFQRINRAALDAGLGILLRRWLPDGQVRGEEFTAKNPRRADRRPGSFKVNTKTGMWADFATTDRGNDPVSLVAFLEGSNQVEGARHLADVLGIDPEA